MTSGARPLVLAGLIVWVGATLLLSTHRWFARRPLTERLRPYSPGGMALASRGGLLSIESFREVVGPLSSRLGEHLSRVLGVHEDLATRLARIHSPYDVTAVRVRQLGWAIGAFGIAGLLTLALQTPAAIALLFLLGAPLFAFLVVEQSVSRASQRWQRHVLLELPVVSEQIGMLLSAGYSLGAAIDRVGTRSAGCCAQDLRVVRSRIQQGLGETEALQEWADRSGVDAVERLVQILALNRQASDLGRLISQEARAIRRDVQRDLVERIERREQQVWIPVTVATLLPGVIFLAVPFIEAMRLFAGS
jgi:Flp pilus assembly protein TadB